MSPKSPKSKHCFHSELSTGRPASRASYASSQVAGDGDSTFGMISAEPGPRLSTAASIASSSSGGKRSSLKSPLGLLKKTSREFAPDKQKLADRLRKRNSYNDSLRYNSPRNGASLRSMRSMADLAEEGRSNSSAMGLPKGNTASMPSSSEPQSPSALAPEGRSNTPVSITAGRVIPTRDSSLRHSFSNSRKPRSSRHSRYSSMGSNELETAKKIFDDGSEAEKITRRIQELKEQQQRIRSENEVGPSSPGSIWAVPSRQARNSQTRSEIIDWEPLLENVADGANGDTTISEESAPSPAVMTGRSRTHNIPHDSRSSMSQSPPEKKSSRYSLERSNSLNTKHHRRLPSNPVPSGRASLGEGRPSSADSIDEAVLTHLTSSKFTQKVTHPTTGRTIAFSEVGDPKGHVVLCCLGMGVTRYLMAFYDELARTLHLRLITLDRPGIGESGPYLDELGTPLSWPDDVAIVCNHLKVTKFSILAHSAGAIYALATALRIPQHIRGRIHLLAPWIPPSQLSSICAQKVPVPSNAVPYSQRILRALPPSVLKVANASFLTATSASITANLPKSSRRSRRKPSGKDSSTPAGAKSSNTQSINEGTAPKTSQITKTPTTSDGSTTNTENTKREIPLATSEAPEARERQIDYDTRLTYKIWQLATTNANPAVDLLVCLERRQEIGFRYADITRPVVVHHGSRDTRVPVDNVRWLGKTMRRCEVRILEGEGHGLMASAPVMSGVLTEIAKEWEDWMKLVQGKRRATVNHAARSGIMLQSS